MMDEKRLKILIFGAGAIGTYVGGSLMHHGHEVIFLERPGMVEPLQAAGLEIRINERTISLPSPVVYSDLKKVLDQVSFDLAILAVKSYDTDDLIASWGEMKALIPPVLCLQNGVENEEKISRALGNERVLSGTVTTAVGKPGLGKIVVEKLRGIGIAAGSPLSQQIVNAMNEAGLKAHLMADAKGMKWSKMLTNLLANASSAILQMPPETIFSDRNLYKIEVLQIRETLAVMQKLNIPIIDLPGTPVRIMAFLMENLPSSLSRLIMKQAMARGRGGKMPSFFLDLQSGRNKSEVVFLNGAVARFAYDSGLSAPINHKLCELLMGIVEGEILPERYSHNKSHYIQDVLLTDRR
jgi:2-dehydropantoate 2-reductase